MHKADDDQDATAILTLTQQSEDQVPAPGILAITVPLSLATPPKVLIPHKRVSVVACGPISLMMT